MWDLLGVLNIHLVFHRLKFGTNGGTANGSMQKRELLNVYQVIIDSESTYKVILNVKLIYFYILIKQVFASVSDNSSNLN